MTAMVDLAEMYDLDIEEVVVIDEEEEVVIIDEIKAGHKEVKCDLEEVTSKEVNEVEKVTSKEVNEEEEVTIKEVNEEEEVVIIHEIKAGHKEVKCDVEKAISEEVNEPLRILVPVRVRTGCTGRGGRNYTHLRPLHCQTRLLDVNMTWAQAFRSEFMFTLPLDTTRYFVCLEKPSEFFLSLSTPKPRYSLNSPVRELLAEYKKNPIGAYKVTIVDVYAMHATDKRKSYDELELAAKRHKIELLQEHLRGLAMSMIPGQGQSQASSEHSLPSTANNRLQENNEKVEELFSNEVKVDNDKARLHHWKEVNNEQEDLENNNDEEDRYEDQEFNGDDEHNTRQFKLFDSVHYTL